MPAYLVEFDFGSSWSDIQITSDATLRAGFEFHQGLPVTGSVNTFRMTTKHLYLAQTAGFTTRVSIALETEAAAFTVLASHSADGALTITPAGLVPTTIPPIGGGVVTISLNLADHLVRHGGSSEPSVVTPSTTASAASALPFQFPKAGEYEIVSQPQFHIKRGNDEELVTCNARLRVNITDAMADEAGARYVSLMPLEWEATGASRLLGGELRYVLVQGLASRVDAGSVASDLPGKMTINGRFATLLNGNQVDEHESSAVGLISSFPPAKGDLFDISGSGVNIADVAVRGVTCVCSSN